MSNPFLIEGPALISFSGGRTSGMMLYKIIEAYAERCPPEDRLPPDVIPVFANTGKEHEATLKFVRDCSVHWDVEIVWLEYRDAEKVADRWLRVDYDSASRHGEPFAAVIAKEKFVPSPLRRTCTKNLKIRQFERYAASLGWEEWDQIIGLRYDEPARVARSRARGLFCPLADAGMTSGDVAEFWAARNFDLGLPKHDGLTLLGNCDLCYLKRTQQTISAIRAEPWRADWWIEQESGGNLFRRDRPNYAALKYMATQPQLPGMESEDSLPCECHD